MPVSALAPAMSRASLTTTPSKPRSSRSTPITVRENVAGRCGSSARDDDVRRHDRGHAGARRRPGRVRARAPGAPRGSRRPGAGRGASRPRCRRGRGSAWRRRRPRWTAGPRPRLPRGGATSAGSSPKLRTPMTGLSGEELTSTSGARSSPMPQRGELVPDAGRDRAGRRRVVEPPEHGVADGGRARGVVQPGDVAALLVDGEEHARHPVVEGGAQRGQPVGAGRRCRRRGTPTPGPRRGRAPASRARSVPGKPGWRVAATSAVRVIPSPPRRRARCSSGPGRRGRR